MIPVMIGTIAGILGAKYIERHHPELIENTIEKAKELFSEAKEKGKECVDEIKDDFKKSFTKEKNEKHPGLADYPLPASARKDSTATGTEPKTKRRKKNN